ncbi:unnamed protein product [Acanthoscelides obtectus]|uniref:Uncharacterized protein n=1 Tax=Acanthoscelides obtectus TaxID=200917 RepID=A0A9P0JVV1_ACAOB|nr:unnamed protein product [Acanthoscelides obtectus]CAK1628057.1 hypothetical protein AOBTE_LOCUS4989 [Acanthoscelides obtectus]
MYFLYYRDSFNQGDRLRLLKLVKIEYRKLKVRREITEDPWETILINVLWTSFPGNSTAKLIAQWKRDSFNQGDRLRLLKLVKIEYRKLKVRREIIEDPWEPILINVLWTSFPGNSTAKLIAQWKRLTDMTEEKKKWTTEEVGI